MLTMSLDASTRPEESVCHLQGLARTSVTVDALPFGQIWFRFVIRVQRTGVLRERATRKHLPSSPKTEPKKGKKDNFPKKGYHLKCIRF